MAIYHSKEKRDLASAVQFYLQREHKEAHSAKANVQATFAILKKQLLLYDDLEPNTSFLHNYLSAGNTVDGSGRFKVTGMERSFSILTNVRSSQLARSPTTSYG